MPEQPMVTRHCALDMQVCVPSEWTDDEVKYGVIDIRSVR